MNWSAKERSGAGSARGLSCPAMPKKALLGGLAGLGQQLTPVRVMRARICIEAAIAREAAISASGEAIIRIKLAKERAMNASSWDGLRDTGRFVSSCRGRGIGQCLAAVFVRST